MKGEKMMKTNRLAWWAMLAMAGVVSCAEARHNEGNEVPVNAEVNNIRVHADQRFVSANQYWDYLEQYQDVDFWKRVVENRDMPDSLWLSFEEMGIAGKRFSEIMEKYGVPSDCRVDFARYGRVIRYGDERDWQILMPNVMVKVLARQMGIICTCRWDSPKDYPGREVYVNFIDDGDERVNLRGWIPFEGHVEKAGTSSKYWKQDDSQNSMGKADQEKAEAKKSLLFAYSYEKQRFASEDEYWAYLDSVNKYYSNNWKQLLRGRDKSDPDSMRLNFEGMGIACKDFSEIMKEYGIPTSFCVSLSRYGRSRYLDFTDWIGISPVVMVKVYDCPMCIICTSIWNYRDEAGWDCEKVVYFMVNPDGTLSPFSGYVLKSMYE